MNFPGFCPLTVCSWQPWAVQLCAWAYTWVHSRILSSSPQAFNVRVIKKMRTMSFAPLLSSSQPAFLFSDREYRPCIHIEEICWGCPTPSPVYASRSQAGQNLPLPWDHLEQVHWCQLPATGTNIQTTGSNACTSTSPTEAKEVAEKHRPAQSSRGRASNNKIIAKNARVLGRKSKSEARNDCGVMLFGY